MIAKRGNAPTILVNSPSGDSQSNERVENEIKKVRHMVITILSSLESRWGVRVTSDHPVYPWMFEWAADLMTRCAHVGDLGKTAVQLIRGSKVKQKRCAIRREDLVQNAETVWSPSRKHGGPVLGWEFSGHETAIRRKSYRNDQRSYQDAHTTIKGEPRQSFPGINSDHVPAAISEKAGVHLGENQADARLGQQDEGIQIR